MFNLVQERQRGVNLPYRRTDLFQQLGNIVLRVPILENPVLVRRRKGQVPALVLVFVLRVLRNHMMVQPLSSDHQRLIRPTPCHILDTVTPAPAENSRNVIPQYGLHCSGMATNRHVKGTDRVPSK